MSVREVVLSGSWLRRMVSHTCYSQSCDREFKAGDTVILATTGKTYCPECFYTSPRGTGAPQKYRIFGYDFRPNEAGSSGSAMALKSIDGVLPDIYISWVKDNERVVAKFMSHEIVSREKLV